MEVKVNYLDPYKGTKKLVEQSGERHGQGIALTRGRSLFLEAEISYRSVTLTVR